MVVEKRVSVVSKDLFLLQRAPDRIGGIWLDVWMNIGL